MRLNLTKAHEFVLKNEGKLQIYDDSGLFIS